MRSFPGTGSTKEFELKRNDDKKKREGAAAGGRLPFLVGAPLWQRCLAAVLAVAAAAVARACLSDFLGPRLPYVTFLPAVLTVFLFAGNAAGLFASIVTACYVNFFLRIDPKQVLMVSTPVERAAILVSLSICLGIALTALMLRQAFRRAEQAETEARLIQERRQAEAALLRNQQQCQEDMRVLNEKLEQRVRERTAQLEAAVREQESFSYSVSHDLRAPLRHINSFSSILAEDFAQDLPQEAKHYLDRIKEATRRMGSLIDHLLELSRLSRAEIAREPVDLSLIACDVADMLREIEPHRQVEFVIQPELGASGDRALLQQLLENLFGNAWKYSSKRTVARIEFGKVQARGRETFLVRDNGIGFDMAYSGRLFEVFQRLHGAEFEGAGIGLGPVNSFV